jgi:hypothetical protein
MGLHEKSKSQTKKDKGEFFHDDKFMMMGAKIGKKWKMSICHNPMKKILSLQR